MRLDKFLQLSRAVKRRVWARAACDEGRVKLNGRVARPHAEVKVEDRIEVDLMEVTGWQISLQVLRVPERGGLRPDDYILERFRQASG